MSEGTLSMYQYSTRTRSRSVKDVAVLSSLANLFAMSSLSADVFQGSLMRHIRRLGLDVGMACETKRIRVTESYFRMTNLQKFGIL